MTRRLLVVALLCLAISPDAESQEGVATPETSVRAGQELATLPAGFDGPSPPVAPAVVTRDANGRATIRATRIVTPLEIDGRLDEDVYATVRSISDFIQSDPQPGELAVEKTEVWLLFDDRNVYVTARCWETRPERRIANEMRRDSRVLFGGDDNFVVNFDTFYDRRNGIMFGVNPVGGRNDGQALGGQQYNGDFNPIWDYQVGRFDNGWTVEMAIPFKSLRYRAGRSQVWGMLAVRQTKWRNEVSFLTRIPSSRGHRGILETSMAATVVGLEAPPGGPNLEFKPYAITTVTTDRTAVPAVANDMGGDAGVDLKYGVTQNLTADVTVNTDFAQVEADEQQVNLTRFSLFLPEKREFFLENQGIFSFGGVATSGSTAGQNDAPILFYSRRIGIQGQRAVPLPGGGRLTGRAGRFSLGALSIQSGEDASVGAESTNFTVLRLKRDVMRKSSVGVLVTRRSVAEAGPGANLAYGVDASLGFFENLFVHGYWARTDTSDRTGDDTSYRVLLDYPGDRYGVQIERLTVGRNFNPETGFVQRDDMQKSLAQFRFSPRPASSATIRKFSYMGTAAYIHNGDGRLETRDLQGEFGIELQNSDKFTLTLRSQYEFLPRPFQIAPDVTLPVGGYDYATARVGYNFGRQRQLSGNVVVEHGTFYNGNKTAISVSEGRFNVAPQLSIEPSLSINWVDLDQGAFTTALVGSRVTYTMTPRMFLGALVQYNSASDAVSTNARFRWEYLPGSEFFVVYNEQRNTPAASFPGIANRAFIVKVNRLLRF